MLQPAPEIFSLHVQPSEAIPISSGGDLPGAIDPAPPPASRSPGMQWLQHLGVVPAPTPSREAQLSKLPSASAWLGQKSRQLLGFPPSPTPGSTTPPSTAGGTAETQGRAEGGRGLAVAGEEGEAGEEGGDGGEGSGPPSEPGGRVSAAGEIRRHANRGGRGNKREDESADLFLAPRTVFENHDPGK